jgi:hypothetical protein
MNSVTKDFLVTALWCEMDEEDDPLEDSYYLNDFAPEALEKAEAIVSGFLANPEVVELLDEYVGEYGYNQVGYDLWLTANGHGAGFWDRGLGEVGERLTEIAKEIGEINVYVGDDGQLYLFP